MELHHPTAEVNLLKLIMRGSFLGHAKIPEQLKDLPLFVWQLLCMSVELSPFLQRRWLSAWGYHYVERSRPAFIPFLIRQFLRSYSVPTTIASSQFLQFPSYLEGRQVREMASRFRHDKSQCAIQANQGILQNVIRLLDAPQGRIAFHHIGGQIPQTFAGMAYQVIASRFISCS